ncbi:MAG: HNH endonuclease [Eubacteriaceae bacterium]
MYELRIKDGRRKTYHKRKELYSHGFTFVRSGKKVGYWKMNFKNKEDAEKKRGLFKKQGFSIVILDPRYVRSHDYRKNFFSVNSGYTYKNEAYYQCVYCGKFVKQQDVTIDHLFPVAKAQESHFNQKVLKKLKINDINQVENLVPACGRCNGRKGSKMGLWLIRGLLGKSLLFWCSFWIAMGLTFIFFLMRLMEFINL